MANKFLPVARRVAKAATVVRRGQKLGTFTDDALLGVQVDQDTRLVQGPRELSATLRKKSFGQRLFPSLQKSTDGTSVDDDAEDDLAALEASLPGGTGADGPRRKAYEEMSGVLHLELLPVAKRGGAETKQKAAQLASQLFQLGAAADLVADDEAPYYHKEGTRDKAETLLETAAAGHGDHADGLFLVRPAKSAGAVALSVFANGQVFHYQFKQQNGEWTHLGTPFEGCTTVALLVARLREADAAAALCHPLRDHVSAAGELVCTEADSTT